MVKKEQGFVSLTVFMYVSNEWSYTSIFGFMYLVI